MSHLNSKNSVFLTGKQDNNECVSQLLRTWKDKVHGIV